MEQFSDVLVIGSGLAGLSYALKVADFARVNLITKNGLTETSTSKAQGGIAAVLGPDDRFEYHIQDTLTVGRACRTRTSWSWWCARARSASGN